jgi:hypothetical protein
MFIKNKKAPKQIVYGLFFLRIVNSLCRKEGIRTLDTLPYTHFPGVRLRPLGHLSNLIYKYNSINPSGAVTCIVLFALSTSLIKSSIIGIKTSLPSLSISKSGCAALSFI